MEAYMLSISKYSSFTVSSIILLLLSMKFLEYTTAFTLGNETDRASLLAFKTEITEDSLGALASWNNSLHICKWDSTRIGQLIQASIPEHELQFSWRHISANLSQCSNLTALVLDHNYFVGQIPYELGYLVNLRQLYLGNNLTESIPASIGNLAALRVLYLSYNHLQGEVPGSISQLRDLAALGLSDNNLYGEFPPALYNMSSLRFIALTDNKFTGFLRPNIGLSWPNLDRIYLAANFFTGQIPYSFSNASNLLQLELLGNQFTGQLQLDDFKPGNTCFKFKPVYRLPVQLMQITTLRAVNFSYNSLTGSIPPDIGDLSILFMLIFPTIGGFSSENLIDSGSFGTVDKGTLSPDETVIAVKGTAPPSARRF
nr:putative receptor-like protein kinase At3g47110 [Coffea arabica]